MRLLLPLALLLVGCTTPTESSVPCGPCAAPGAMPPSAGAVAVAIEAGRVQAHATCPSVTETMPAPAVSWWTCRMSVYGYDTPGGRSRSICATGATEPDGSRIYVSLDDPANVLPLVRWEARNSYWIRAGCGDQAL